MKKKIVGWRNFLFFTTAKMQTHETDEESISPDISFAANATIGFLIPVKRRQRYKNFTLPR
jgi:hypothetical protein